MVDRELWFVTLNHKQPGLTVVCHDEASSAALVSASSINSKASLEVSRDGVEFFTCCNLKEGCSSPINLPIHGKLDIRMRHPSVSHHVVLFGFSVMNVSLIKLEKSAKSLVKRQVTFNERVECSLGDGLVLKRLVEGRSPDRSLCYTGTCLK
jgi:hypothetical protein